jgi:outer membrane protein OmpA-like peptidoglycan-associated protein
MKILLLFVAASTVAFAQPKLLLNEDFNTENFYWPITEHQSIASGALIINAPEDGDQSLINILIDPEKDYVITATLSQKAGLSEGGFGIAWGSDENYYNLFVINSSQNYAVFSGDPTHLKKWKKSSAIKPFSESNVLRIEKKSTKTSFFINDVLLEEQKPFPFFGNWAGIVILSQMQVGVDNFSIRQDQQVQLPQKADEFLAKENLGNGVNSEVDELGPVISSDGKTLYFSRQNVKENVGGEYDDEDVYISTWQNNAWTRAANMGKAVNTSAADNLISVSADNNTMLFEKDNAFAVRHRTINGWSPFEKLDINIKNESDYFVASLSADGKAIVFSAKLKQNAYYDPARDENDLYVTIKDKAGKWSAPINLGKVVNTISDETSPFLSADGKTLYFASNGRPGFGYHDIFYAKRASDSWTEWSTPVNLGPKINTKGFDAYYTVPASGDYAYFVSYDKGFGKADIFRTKLHEDVKPSAVILVKGQVLNNNTKAPLAATIHFEDLNSHVEIGEARTDPKTGQYQIVLPYGIHYGIRAKVDGFYSVHENLELNERAGYGEIEKNLQMVPIEVGETVKLNNVFFEAGLAVLKPESFPELDRLVRILEENPGIYIELAGHTDAKGSAETLMKLSKDRVDAVKAYLVKKNISGDRITGQGYGATKPVAPSDTEENSKLNRRVEFKIMKK